MDWYNKLWSYSVELFRNLEIPVRQLECCSGDLADLKVKSCDIEAWSPRQKKYFEVCSCSNLGDAQARRLKIRYKDENGKMQGYDEFLTQYKADDPGSFVVDEPAPAKKGPSITVPAKPDGGTHKMSLSEQMAAANADPNFVPDFD